MKATNISKKIDIREKITLSIPEVVSLDENKKYNRQTPIKILLVSFPSYVRLYLLNRNGEWTCAHGLNSPARLSKNGNIECMSHDGKNCIVTHPTACKGLKKNPPSKLKPLECGDMHMRKWGISGYETGNWCDNTRNMIIMDAKAVLVNEKKNLILATGKMKASEFMVKKIFTDFLPILQRVERSSKCAYPTLGNDISVKTIKKKK